MVSKHERDQALIVNAMLITEMGRKVGRVTPFAPFAHRRSRTGAHGVTRPTNLTQLRNAVLPLVYFPVRGLQTQTSRTNEKPLPILSEGVSMLWL